MNKEIEKAKEESYWKGYLQKQSEAVEICKMCKYRKNYKELTKKSEILDKITDKLQEDMVKAKEQIKYWEKEYQAVYIKKDEFYKNSYKRQINMWQSRRETLQEILNVIEGGE